MRSSNVEGYNHAGGRQGRDQLLAHLTEPRTCEQPASLNPKAQTLDLLTLLRGRRRQRRRSGPAREQHDAHATAHDGSVTAVLQTPDGHSWLTAGNDSRVRLWDARHCRRGPVRLCLNLAWGLLSLIARFRR